MEILTVILNLVAGLVGFPAFLAVAINIAKYFGLPDGAAPTVNFWAHLVVYVGVGVAVLLGKVDLLPGIDLALSNIANILLSLLAFLTSIGIAKFTHNSVLRRFPVIGYIQPHDVPKVSYSYERK
jgi:hypothetical protein